MIDIDSLLWDGDIADQKTMLEYTTSQLRVEFQQVDCWYHFSSSMGIKAGIRVHLWYWLNRPCSDADLKACLSGCPLDLRLFNSISPLIHSLRSGPLTLIQTGLGCLKPVIRLRLYPFLMILLLACRR